MTFTQEQIDRITDRAKALYESGADDDVEVDPIRAEEQNTALSLNDEGGCWVRAWVYVRLAEVFGLTCEKCGHQCIPDKVCEKCGGDPTCVGDTLCVDCDKG